MDYRDCVLFRYFAAGSSNGAVRDKSIVTPLTQQYICDGTRIIRTQAPVLSGPFHHYTLKSRSTNADQARCRYLKRCVATKTRCRYAR